MMTGANPFTDPAQVSARIQRAVRKRRETTGTFRANGT
jgi:hypothetical protein